MLKAIGRRQVIKGSVAASAIALAAGRSAAQTCSTQVTPMQAEGPFYPEQRPENWEPDTDLTKVEGSNVGALGKKMVIIGQITDMQCKPIPGARIEVWQADWQGVYNHSRDPRRQELDPDPNFQFWAAATTNSQAQFSFRTIKPGAYPAGTNWIRPMHIHIKAYAADHLPVTTQIYFAPSAEDVYDPIVLRTVPGLEEFYAQQGGLAVSEYLLRADFILDQVPVADRHLVVLNQVGEDKGVPVYGLTIKLRSVLA